MGEQRVFAVFIRSVDVEGKLRPEGSKHPVRAQVGSGIDRLRGAALGRRI